MRKVSITESGGPDVLRFVEVPEPEPASNQVLVDVKAVGLNFSEIMIRNGNWPIDLSQGFTPGAEGAGVVEKAGFEVEAFQPGDKVAVFDVSAYSEPGQGLYAEKVVVDVNKVLRIPEAMDFATAAAQPMAWLTAYDAMIKHSPLPEQGTAVLTACTGAVGVAALQIARTKGLRVLGTTRKEENSGRILEFGAEPVVAEDPADLKEKISNLVGGEGIDYLFDPVCGETATQLTSLLNCNGTYVNYGVLTGARFELPETFLFNQLRLHGYVVLINLADPNRLQSLWREVYPWLESPRVSIPIHKTFPFEQVAEAHREMEDRPHFGKIVLVR